MNNIEFWSHRGSYWKIKAYDSMGRMEKMITRLESLVCQWKQSWLDMHGASLVSGPHLLFLNPGMGTSSSSSPFFR